MLYQILATTVSLKLPPNFPVQLWSGPAFLAGGFPPDSRRPKRYVDVWQDDETIIALLPKDTEVEAAFTLSRAVHPEGCAFV